MRELDHQQPDSLRLLHRSRVSPRPVDFDERSQEQIAPSRKRVGDPDPIGKRRSGLVPDIEVEFTSDPMTEDEQREAEDALMDVLFDLCMKRREGDMISEIRPDVSGRSGSEQLQLV